MAKKIVISDDQKRIIRHSVPDALVAQQNHRFLTLIEELVAAVNELQDRVTDLETP